MDAKSAQPAIAHMDVKDKVILLTGASEGIGKATALLLGKLGARLAISARSKDKLEELAKQIPGSFVVPADLHDLEQVKQMVKKAHEHFGRIDVLINNAGQSTYAPVEHIEIDAMKSIMNLNVYAVITAMQAVIPIMRAQGGGRIINIGSRTTEMFAPMLSPYAATKSALNMITLTARTELAKDKIIVSLVVPQLTATDFQKNSVKPQGAWFKGIDRSGFSHMVADPVEKVADKIKLAIESGAARVCLWE